MTSHPILITGAGRNVGAALARALLAAGRPVLAHYRSQTDEIAALAAAGAQTVQGELDDEATITALAGRIGATAPRLSGIIHNASAFGPTPDDIAAAAADYRRYWSVHMLAPYLLQRHLEDRLAGPDGRPADIIAITDIYADRPAPDYDIYCATKAGLQNMALSSALRLAPSVKVNVIQPGPINFTGWHDDEQKARVLAQTPMGRAGGPQALITAVFGILQNDYQTGAIIAVDGGRRLGSA